MLLARCPVGHRLWFYKGIYHDRCQSNDYQKPMEFLAKRTYVHTYGLTFLTLTQVEPEKIPLKSSRGQFYTWIHLFITVLELNFFYQKERVIFRRWLSLAKKEKKYFWFVHWMIPSWKNSSSQYTPLEAHQTTSEKE